jgi:hypothetical protein
MIPVLQKKYYRNMQHRNSMIGKMIGKKDEGTQ